MDFPLTSRQNVNKNIKYLLRMLEGKHISQSQGRAQIGISVELDFFVDSYSWMKTEQRTVVQ